MAKQTERFLCARSRTKHSENRLSDLPVTVAILSALLFLTLPVAANGQVPNIQATFYFVERGHSNWSGAWNYDPQLGPPLGNPCWKPSTSGLIDDQRPYLTPLPDGTLNSACNLDKSFARTTDGKTGFKTSAKLTGNFKCDRANFVLDGTYETVYDNGSATFHIQYQGSSNSTNEFGDIVGIAQYSWTCSYIRGGKQYSCYDANKYPTSGTAQWGMRGLGCGVTQPTQAAIHPPAVGTFGVGHGCAYNSLQYASQVFCAATTTNELPNATIEYQWTFDGEAPTKGSNTFSRKDDAIAPGSHTVTVIAKDTKNNKQASSSFTFTKAGADPYVTVQCALRSGDDRAVACYADPKNLPEGTTLTYEWTWSGARDGEPGRTLSKNNLSDGVYYISVRAKDNKSGKYTPSASTSITIGNPPPGINLAGLLDGINSVLTGKPLPNPPDPTAAAAAGATTAILTGLGALANALTSSSGTKTQTAKPADTQQTERTSDGKSKPVDLPEQGESAAETEEKKAKPTVKPNVTPPRVFDKPDKPETKDKTDEKDKPAAKPDTTTAKPTILPEQKPQLTPEQIADRRQQADRLRQEGMAEQDSEYWWGWGRDIGYYGAKTVKYGADVTVDFLSNLTGPAGKAVKYIYAGSKNFSEAAMQSYYDGKGRENMIKAAANTAIDIGASALGSKFNFKPKPNPVDGFTRSPDQYTDKMRHYSVEYVQALLTRERTLPSGSRIVHDRFIEAGIATVQSEMRRILIKDPIKIDMGLKEGKYLEQWW